MPYSGCSSLLWSKFQVCFLFSDYFGDMTYKKGNTTDKIKVYSPCWWIGFQCLKVRESLQRYCLVLTTKFLEDSDTHLIFFTGPLDLNGRTIWIITLMSSKYR